MTKPVFKLCAVANDDGPYLAEWIFHHLHFGFDLIHVYVNRTSDASQSVLERIQRTYPQVTFESIDWVDLSDSAIRTKEISQSQRQGVDWLMFLDIDEFWTPNDFKTPVDRFVADVGEADQAPPICLLRHCELGQHSPFTPLQRGAGYEISAHLKTLFPLENIESKQVRAHLPIFDTGVTPDGAPMVFNKDQPELAGDSAVTPKRTYIIHRMYRSEAEYMALALKGQPSHRSQLKLNRSGYRSHRNVPVRRRFIWPEPAFRDYALKRRVFLGSNDIESLIHQDKANIINRSRQAVALLEAMLETPDRERALAFLKGTQYDETEHKDAPATELSSGQAAPRQAGKVSEPASVVATEPELAMAEEIPPVRIAEPTPTEPSRELATEPLYAITAEPAAREETVYSTSDELEETKSHFSIMKLVLFGVFAVFIWYAIRGSISS